MAIAKKPKVSQVDTFIAGAEKTAKVGKLQTTMRLDAGLLSRVDAAAKRRGVSRSAWVSYALSRALDDDI